MHTRRTTPRSHSTRLLTLLEIRLIRTTSTKSRRSALPTTWTKGKQIYRAPESVWNQQKLTSPKLLSIWTAIIPLMFGVTSVTQFLNLIQRALKTTVLLCCYQSRRPGISSCIVQRTLSALIWFTSAASVFLTARSTAVFLAPTSQKQWKLFWNLLNCTMDLTLTTWSKWNSTLMTCFPWISCATERDHCLWLSRRSVD